MKRRVASWGLFVLVFLQLLGPLRWLWNSTVPFNPVTSVLSLVAMVVLAVLSLAFAFLLVEYFGKDKQRKSGRWRQVFAGET